MYRTLKQISSRTLLLLAAALFAALTLVLARNYPAVWFSVAAGAFFVFIAQLNDYGDNFLANLLYKVFFLKGDSRFLNEFLNKLRICFTTNELIDVIQDVLEAKADCSVLYINTKNSYSIYNSPARLTSMPETFRTVIRNYSLWKEGFFIFEENLGLTEHYHKARGFFMVYGELQLFVFSRFTRLNDRDIYAELYREFVTYIEREKTIQRMFAIAALSKEWELVAQTQRSFLPTTMPKMDRLEVASFYRPLVNVSGDYYDVLPIDEHRTLMVLGDVSGKGLAAALIMGIIVNTIKISDNKTNLEALIRAIDLAIKGMRFEDKYTVLFLGVVDTEKRTLQYVNASMSEPLLVTRGDEGVEILTLDSNCSLVGIIDIDRIDVTEIPIQEGDALIIASDGVTEVANKEGVQLSDNKVYLSTIKQLRDASAQEIVDSIADLVLTYTGDRKLRDDVTMLVAKVG